MSQNLNDVVRVVIYDQTTAVATTSFSVPLILAEFSNFVERVRVYSSFEEIAEDFTETDAVYDIATKLFGQSGVLGAPVSRVVVGRKDELETYTEALAAVEQENGEWYCLIADTQDATDQEALSDAIGAREKIYALSTADSDAPTTATTDIGAVLSAKSAARTFGVYLPTAATEYPEAAWVGSQLAVTPGRNDWDFKRANGVTVSNLSSTALTNLRDKNYNYYIRKGGVNIFQNGDMFDSKPIDIQISKDWLKARLQETIYFRLINVLKIPLTLAA